MKKVVNKKNIVIYVIIILLCIVLGTIFFLNVKSNKTLKDKNINNIEIKETNEEVQKIQENLEENSDDISKIEMEEEPEKVINESANKQENNIKPDIKNEKEENKSNETNKNTIPENNSNNKSDNVTSDNNNSNQDKNEVPAPTVKTEEQKNNELRNQLLAKYNVFIGYKDEIDGKYMNPYAKPTKLYDDEVIGYNLTKIENALNKYPQSFFTEIKNNWKPLSIYLVDSINGSAAGLADNNNSNTVIILIVATHNSSSSILESTVHHEIMHVIDCYFTSKGIYSASLLEQNMMQYNPPGFTYGYQSNQYVYLLDNPYYFVSKYSKSNYKEDRAEIFANLMYRSIAPAFLKADNPIKEKAKLISEQINHNFNSASTSNNHWDRFLK